MTRTLCIGGPLDGHMTANTDPQFTTMAPRNRVRYKSSDYYPHRFVYTRTQLKVFDNEPIPFYLADGMTLNTAMMRLAAHYRPEPWVFG